MSQPTPYTRKYNFSAYQAANPADPLPGQKVDIEFNAVKASFDEFLANLALIQRDDGKLANGSVGLSQLDGNLISLGFERPDSWATATVYDVDDAVFINNKLYFCLIAHTSGVFATDLVALKWVLAADFTTLITDAQAAASAAAASAAAGLGSQNAAATSASSASVSATSSSAALSAILAGFYDWYGTATGTTAYTVGANAYTPAVLADGFQVEFRVGNPNGAGITLVVGGYAAKSVVHYDGSAILAGDWPAGAVVSLSYSSTLDQYCWKGNARQTRMASLTTANTFTAANTFSAAVNTDGDHASTGGPVVTPGGRLTLTAAIPVLSSDVTAATTVYYTPYQHNMISLYDGTRWVRKFFTEMSQTLADATKSPAAAAVSSLYDMFVWLDGSTLRCTRGPAWSTAVTRGTGAGTTELERLNGAMVNKIAITNGPAARRGLYVGTIATSATGANGQMNMMFAPAPAAGGTGNRLDVWNAYNQLRTTSLCRESTGSWAYAVAAWRPFNNSVLNRITAVNGLNEGAASATAVAFMQNNQEGGVQTTGIGLDSTSAFSGLTGAGGGNGTANVQISLNGSYFGLLGLGQHYLQHLEYSNGTGSSTWGGDFGTPLITQSGIQMTMDM